MHKIQERKRCEAIDLIEKSWQCYVLDEKNPHIRNNWDGTVIKLDANNGVCLDETGPVFSWQGQ